MVALSSFIQFHAQRTPERLALICGDDKITYAEDDASHRNDGGLAGGAGNRARPRGCSSDEE
jgi:non-ribosomal peptide synthetase component E (peptide arylation enzyme)